MKVLVKIGLKVPAVKAIVRIIKLVGFFFKTGVPRNNNLGQSEAWVNAVLFGRCVEFLPDITSYTYGFRVQKLKGLNEGA